MTLEEKLATTGNYIPVILTKDDVFELKALQKSLASELSFNSICEGRLTDSDRESWHLKETLDRILKQVKE